MDVLKNLKPRLALRPQFSRSDEKEETESAVFIELTQQKPETSLVAPPVFLEVFAVHGVGVDGNGWWKELAEDEGCPLHVIAGGDEGYGGDAVASHELTGVHGVLKSVGGHLFEVDITSATLPRLLMK
jgi:hypothetical protein